MRLQWVEHGSPEYRETIELRREILRLPLGLDFTEEDIEAEAAELHLAAWDERGLAGCLVLVPYGSDAKMQPVAVQPDRQGTGIGRAMVDEFERQASRDGYRRIVLNARDTAVPFYEKLGYAVEGEMFEEVTIPHFRMVKKLG